MCRFFELASRVADAAFCDKKLEQSGQSRRVRRWCETKRRMCHTPDSAALSSAPAAGGVRRRVIATRFFPRYDSASGKSAYGIRKNIRHIRTHAHAHPTHTHTHTQTHTHTHTHTCTHACTQTYTHDTMTHTYQCLVGCKDCLSLKPLGCDSASGTSANLAWLSVRQCRTCLCLHSWLAVFRSVAPPLSRLLSGCTGESGQGRRRCVLCAGGRRNSAP